MSAESQETGPLYERPTFKFRSRTPASATSPPRADVKPNMLVRLLFVAGFVICAPAFTIQFGWDPGQGRFVGSPILSAMTLFSQILALAAIASSAESRRLLRASWPILVFMGISLASVVWSFDPGATLDASLRTLPPFLLGVALVGYYSGFGSIRFIIRSMVFVCGLSAMWVVIFPGIAVHQSSDVIQSVHAGLWRGVFSHKQGLGYFAGATTGLLLYYRTAVFSIVLLLPSLALSLTCLIGTQSATGFITAAITPALLAAAKSIAVAAPRNRPARAVQFLGLAVIIGAATKVGVLDFVITGILGKSTDLTGRSDFWPIELQNFIASGRMWLGAGIGTDFYTELSEWSVDNGYLDILFYFGYLLAPVVYFAYGAIIWRSIKRLLNSTPETLNVDVFPIGIMLVILIANITESNFLTKSWGTLLTGTVAAIVFSDSGTRRTNKANDGR